jgi:hypothetical protein
MDILDPTFQQVVSTTPDEFESFEFSFAQKKAHIYRLGNGVILLVVMHETINMQTYQALIEQLKEALESDPHSAVSTFQLLAGSTTLNRPMTEAELPLQSGQTSSVSSVSSVSAPSLAVGDPEYPWLECLQALNQLTEATAQYLGKIVVANTWRTTRPADDTLPLLKLDRNGQFSLGGEGNPSSLPIAGTDLMALRGWVASFVQRCSLIIRDYPELVLKVALSEPQQVVLGIHPPV